MTSVRVEIILDNSGSMYMQAFTDGRFNRHLIPNLAEGLHGLSKDLQLKGIATSFHVFSDDVASGSDVGALLAKQQPRYTHIAAGFRGMLASFPKVEVPQQAVVIFISDGADTFGKDGLADMKRLPPLPVTSTLLTVAVGKDFPTSTVLNELYGKYYTNEERSYPFVFPIDPLGDNCSEVMADILAQLNGIVLEIASGVPRKQPTVADLEGMDNAGILGVCRQWYNEASVKILLACPLPEKIALVTDLKHRLNAADKLMRLGMLAQSKPLLISNLRKTVSVHHLSSIREKINVTLSQLNKGRLLDDLSDVEKADFMAFGNKVGKFSVKAAKYRGADTDLVLQRLKERAATYEASELDRQLTDVFHLCSLAEIWEDVKANTELLQSIDSMGDIFRSIAFFGRGLELFELPECAQLNPWVVSVRSLPTMVQIINTHDLYYLSKGKFTARDETHNNLLILGGSPKFLEVETHVQTFTIAGWSYYHKDARLAMVAAVLVFLFKRKDGLPEWKMAELKLLRSVLDLHTRENSRWWHEYCDMLASEPRNCLVTESVQLPPSIRCQGLGKFILALWCSIDKGAKYDLQRLASLRLALVVEFLGRSKVSMADFVKVRPVFPHAEVMPWAKMQGQISARHIYMQQIRNLLRVECAALLRTAVESNDSNHTETPNLVQLGGRDFKEHYHLSLENIETVFANLAGLCSISDWPALTEDELLRALLIVHTRGASFARNCPDEEYLTAPMPAVKCAIAAALAAVWKAQSMHAIYEEACKQAADYLQEQHCGLPRRIPEAYVLRYKEETGRDIGVDFKVDPLTRLSRVACCFPNCSLFLAIPTGSEKQQCSLLKAHLQACCQTVIPGLHTCVVKHSRSPVSQVLDKVVTGYYLKQPYPSRSFGREGYDLADIQLSKTAQRRKLDQAVASYNKGDSMRLYHLIERMQDSIVSKAQCWSYEVFKAAFDAKYAE